MRSQVRPVKTHFLSEFAFAPVQPKAKAQPALIPQLFASPTVLILSPVRRVFLTLLSYRGVGCYFVAAAFGDCPGSSLPRELFSGQIFLAKEVSPRVVEMFLGNPFCFLSLC